MLGDVLLLDDDGALQAEVIRGQAGGDGIVLDSLADLGNNGDLVIDLAQDGLVVLDAGVYGLLALVHETLHMFCMLC